MHIRDRFLSFIQEHALFQERDKILLAVSGGRDSVLMAQLFKLSNLNFGIAHCNFQLRNSESDEDEQFCSALAGKLEVPFFSVRFDTEDYAKRHKISIQMAARDLRYLWLEEIRADFGFAAIALAQHKNDEIETLLLNLTRGTGIAGLHGIYPKRGRLIRPLLFLTRAEVDKIVECEAYSFREDSSNLSDKYSRNLIRQQVVPALKKINPSLEHTFEENRKRFAELEEILEHRLLEIKARLFTTSEDGSVSIGLDELKNMRPLNTLLFGLFQPYHFSHAVLQDLSRSWNGNAGKIFKSNTHQLILDRSRLILSSRKADGSDEICTFDISDHRLQWRGQQFNTQILDNDKYLIRKSNLLAQLDLEKLKFPLRIRSWQEGDHFFPMGMQGKKKLSDLFISEKIPLTTKDKIPVLENGNGDILWVGGLRTDRRYIITDNTKKVFIFEQFI